MRINNKGNNMASRLSNFKSNIKIKINTKMNKSALMKAIREYCPTDLVKATYSKYDFRKQHSGLNKPIIDKPTKVPGFVFNRKRYAIESNNEFKRTAANHFVSKVNDTPKNTLLNYPSYKYYDKLGKENPNIKYLCEVLVSKHLAATIATRRAAWVNIFFYNFHKIGDFSKSLIAKNILLEKEEDKKGALLGIKCHQRGTEPYFPSTSFVSGKQYDYSNSKDRAKKNTHNEEVTADTNKDKDMGNSKNNDPKDNKISKGKKYGNTKHKFTKVDTKLYVCTDDCIEATDEEYKSFQKVLHTFDTATNKNIRTILEKYDACTNMKLDDMYLLPREKRNHPLKCYEGCCQSYFVLVRKLAIHYKNCHIFMKCLVNLNTAHQFIHDIDVATVLGDIDYLIKLVAFQTDKSPTVFSPSDFPSTENRNYDDHISTFYKRCEDLPDIECQSCIRLVLKSEIVYPKERWVNVKSTNKNGAWNQFKDLLGIKIFENNNVKICKGCQINYNDNKIPPRSRLNNMDRGEVPKEIAVLTPIELMFISRVKVFQSVVKLGAVGKHAPHNSRLSALKGNAIHLPLPLEQTIKQLEEETDFTKIPDNYIITHQIKNDELLLRNLVSLDNVHAALCWLKENNPFYKDINIPPKQLLFSDVSTVQSPIQKITCDLSSSDENDSDMDIESCKLDSANVCHDKTKTIPIQSSSSDMDVQILPTGTECPLSRDEGDVVKKGKIQMDDTVSNDPIKPRNIDTEETTKNSEAFEEGSQSNPPKMIEKMGLLTQQYDFEHYSVVNPNQQGISYMSEDNLYKFATNTSEPLTYKEKNIDLLSFPNIFPLGKAGENSPRQATLLPKYYEKTRLLSGCSEVRRNILYIFYLFHRLERRLIGQGVYLTLKNVKFLQGKNVEQLTKMLLNNDQNIERNLNRAVSKIPNSPSYWNAPRSMLKCMSETHGPATFFITFSPAEYDWVDLHDYLKRHNTDLKVPDRSLLTMDPVLTSTYIHTKFEALHAFILESCCLGNVDHWFYRIEYQSRGTPHFHCMYWIKDAPIIGQSSDEAVMKFINDHITCKLPAQSENSALRELVEKNLQHKCGKYCKRSIKTKTGYIPACRFGFPRKVTTKLILNDVLVAILGRKSSGFHKRLYHLPRSTEEKTINDYNPVLLDIWKGNMDIQFIGEDSYSLEQYITKYITKADKSHLSKADFGLNDSILSKCWKFVFMILRSREIGAYEAWDRWLLDALYKCSDMFQFVSTVFLKHRSRTMKNHADLEKAGSKSTDIFQKDLLSTFYPERPSNLEKMSLKEYAANYVRAYTKKKANTDDGEITEDHTSSHANKSLIKLNGDNGYVRKRPKEVLIYHHEFDPRVYPERYYYSMLLLFKPWRKEDDLKGKCKTLQEAFEQGLNEFPKMKAYDNLKQKIDYSRKIVEDKVSKKLQQIEEEGLDSEPEEVETDDISTLDQVMADFDDINNVGDISTEEELIALVETLNPEQRKIYDKITNAVSHSVAHAIKECTCKSFQPLYLYVSGFGGTGKSYLIKAIMAWAYITSNVLKKKCKIVLAAPTGISAAGINGMTLHSVLSLPIEHHGKMRYKPLTGPKLQQIQALMKNVHCVMVDEISMVSNLTLLHVHLRLSDIFRCKYGNENWFGSQNVVVFGDLLQLPPVKGDEVFINLSEKQVKEITGMMSTNLSLFSHFEYEELTINQ